MSGCAFVGSYSTFAATVSSRVIGIVTGIVLVLGVAFWLGQRGLPTGGKEAHAEDELDRKRPRYEGATKGAVEPEIPSLAPREGAPRVAERAEPSLAPLGPDAAGPPATLALPGAGPERRTVSARSAMALASTLRQLPPMDFDLASAANDPVARELAEQLRTALVNGGWKNVGGGAIASAPVGLVVNLPAPAPETTAFLDWATREGLHPDVRIQPTAVRVRIVVGSRR